MIYTYIDKEKDENSREKDLIINRVEEVYQFVKDQSYSFVDNQLSLTSAAAYIKRIRVQVTSIEELLIVADRKYDGNFSKELNDILRELKDLLTKTPVKQKANIPDGFSIKVINNIVYSSEERMNLIEVTYDRLRNKILEFQLQINRS